MTTTLIDRFVHWTLDFDGDLYGDDERERLRWYEGTATAAQVQWIAVPWAAAAAVWAFGKPVVLPLIIVLAVLLVPLVFCAFYVEGKRVSTTPRTWSRKRLLLGVLAGLPYFVFAVGALYHLDGPESSTWKGAIVGGFIGLAFGAVMQARQTRKRRRLDAAVVLDED
jgi:hypothetical protein